MSSDLSLKFLKIYANLPLAAREEVIVVIGDEPMSWNALRIEVENNTPKGLEGLTILSRLKIIQ
jgi:hypothetical protein